MKNINKILGIIVCIGLIIINISAQPVKLVGNETAYVEDIVNDYINSSNINLTNYELRVVPRAVPANGTKLVNVFLIPGNSTTWSMKFRVDLNSSEVIGNFTRLGNVFGKSKQNKSMIKEALEIANNDPEIKKKFAQLNFTKIPHMRASNKSKVHIIFVPMNAYEKVKSGLERRHNVSVIDVNISFEDKKVLKFEIKELLAGNKSKGLDTAGVNATPPVDTGTPPAGTDTTPLVDTDTTPPVDTDTTPAGTGTTPAGTDTTPAGTGTTPAGTDTTPAGTGTTPVEVPHR